MANKDYIYKKTFELKDEYDKYTFKIQKRNWKWLWLLLLLLLLLLLFVRCDHKINVHTRDAVSGEAIPEVNVSLDYTAHYLYKDGSFFASEPVHSEITTDENGDGTFDKQPCSVFSYIFYALSEATYTTEDDCNEQVNVPETSVFHYTWNKTIDMQPKTEDLELMVLDRETEEPLAGAVVSYEYELSGEAFIDSIETDPSGRCMLSGVPRCGEVLLPRVSCYGYADTTDVQLNVKTALSSIDMSTIKLTPLKQSFSYFVKNKYTKEPVPGATVEVTLTSSNGKVIRGKSVTNVDGKGLGEYKDAFVLAQLDLKASKQHYKDGYLEKKYTVEQFAGLPDDDRVVYLEPEPYMEKFQNVDSITGEPIAGVKNKIHINSISGKEEDLVELSNRNGIFYVKAMEGDHITINSELSPYYEPKNTEIKSFAKGQIIKMMPQKTDLVFRTYDAETGELLPDCKLSIRTSKSGVNMPTSSGNGEFTVKDLFVGEKISIVASKMDYGSNSTKINNDKVIDLMNANQDRRDIPLKMELPPCNASSQNKSSVQAGSVSTQSYNMGMNSGTFEITYDTGSSCTDCIEIYSHKPGENYLSGERVFSSGQVATDGKKTATVRFQSGSVITVIVTTGPSDGSFWDYHISCPK